jgi:ferredoxin-NADP reductase
MTVEGTTRRLPLAIRPLPPLAGPARPGRVLADNATITLRTDLTDAIARFVVRADERTPHIEPGQYLALGLPVGGRLVQRPYSTATSSGAHHDLEFLVRLVPGGAFTPHLWRRAPGDRLWLGRPKGLFTLIPDDPRTHLFVATGTGVAPFVAMVEALQARPDRPHAVVVHGVSHVAELAFRARFERWAAGGRVTYLPAISRPADPRNVGWVGRTGRLDAVIPAIVEAHGLDPAGTVAYLCGNPGMIAATERVLAGVGLPDAAIRSEHYWPA